MKLWAGRFQKDTDEAVNDFNASIRFDRRMYKEDITGSIAHATMLGECGIISSSEAEQITSELKNILADIEAGKEQFSPDAEDIHMYIETLLTQRIGDAGKKLHTGRSRNDQVALDLRMHTIGECRTVLALLVQLQKVLLKKAQTNVGTIMPGYTHLQRAQPVTFAHHMLAYSEMFKRDYSRLCDCLSRMDESPIGAGALATTTHPLNRQRTAQLLGFSRICVNSMDAVSDRDFVIEFASCLSLIMMHLSRFCEEIILWCSTEFGFIELDDAYATGSSIMPQKKNPDVAELVRGKTGRVYGSLIALLTTMKGLPLAYNKDMQEDKEAIFDAADTVKICLELFSKMLDTAQVKEAAMRKAAAGGFTNATDCADYLVRGGLPFRDAYKIVGQLVGYCINKQTSLEELTLEDLQSFCPLFGDDVHEALSLDTCINERKVEGGPSSASINRQIAALKAYLKEVEPT